MASILEKAISILAGNMNSGLSYLITTVFCVPPSGLQGLACNGHLGTFYAVWGDPSCSQARARK